MRNAKRQKINLQHCCISKKNLNDDQIILGFIILLMDIDLLANIFLEYFQWVVKLPLKKLLNKFAKLKLKNKS